jgi:CubicO group peptidase (beta-lactamase class C family)
VFDYDSGHEENHAGQFQPEINGLDTSMVGSAIATGLNVSGITLHYNQPLLAGGIYASANDYTPILRAILGGQLGMLDALGMNPVCAWTGTADCNAAYSPIVSEHWHYSIAHWVEDDPTSGDGAFSSPGAFGFYPWIESNKRYYGVISRSAPAGTGVQNGLASALCGRELRKAWETGVQQ